MHDNAPSHAAIGTRQFFEAKRNFWENVDDFASSEPWSFPMGNSEEHFCW